MHADINRLRIPGIDTLYNWAMEFASSTISQLGLASFPEALVIVGAWVLLTVFGFTMGSSRLDAVGLTFLTAALLVQHVSSAWLVGSAIGGIESTWTSTLIAVMALVIVCYLVFLRLCDTGFVDSGGLVSAGLSALAVVAIVLTLWASAFPTIYPFPALLAPIFTPSYTFWWLVGSLAVLAIVRQKRMWS